MEDGGRTRLEKSRTTRQQKSYRYRFLLQRTHALDRFGQVGGFTEISSEELDVFIMVSLDEVENCDGLLATVQESFDDVSAQETATANDEIRLAFGRSC